MKKTEEQLEGIKKVRDNPAVKIDAVAGSGKEQPVWCKVQTPHGPKAIGDLCIGDVLHGADGSLQSVVSTHPQGISDYYKITFRDGSHTFCGLNHLWTVNNAGGQGNKYKTLSLSDILRRGITKTCGDYKFRIPLCSPVEYPKSDLKLHPYIMGLLIGDGWICGKTPHLSFNADDPEIINEIKSYHQYIKLNVRSTGGKGLQSSLLPVHKTNRNSPNWIMEYIKQLGLHVRSGDKFIPSDYLRSSCADRIDLLRGLMDSDGSCRRNRTSFSTTSVELKMNIIELVQSLGGVAIEGKPDLRKEAACYHVNIKTTFCPFGVSKKRLNWEASSKNPPSRYIADVEYMGKCQQVCIKVSNPDQLYLTDNFIVTHNTTTLRMITEEIPMRTLLLVYNKAAQEDAKAKFPRHVECRTTHSLAYKSVGIKYQSKLKRPYGGYVNVCGTSGEIAKYFNLEPIEGDGNKKISPSLLGNLIRSCVAKFESSADEVISKKHTVNISFVSEKYNVWAKTIQDTVLKYAEMLWQMRIDLNSPIIISHDTYLKLYQLSNPKLDYDMILLDEAQDSSDCVLDIVTRQANSKLVMVGDTRQSIYQWRGAINAMKKVDWPVSNLSTSFRYGQEVASLASRIIQRQITSHESTNTVVGPDVVDKNNPYTILYRGNSNLISDAVNEIMRGNRSIRIEIDTKDFEKKLKSFVALYSGDTKNIKHDDVLVYESWDDVLEEAEFSLELTRIRKMVEGGFAYKVIQCLEDHQNIPYGASITFTTAHKSKGREWEQVVLADDFPVPDPDNPHSLPEEEQNLLYVACTRATKALNINNSCVYYLDRENVKEEKVCMNH